MFDKKEELIKIFENLFEVTEGEALEASIENTEKWDSMSHMNLILEIESKFTSVHTTASDLMNLTSFSKCYELICRIS